MSEIGQVEDDDLLGPAEEPIPTELGPDPDSPLAEVAEAREKRRNVKLNKRFWQALESDDTDEVEELIRQGADPNAVSTGYRQLTPLQLAIEENNLVTAVILLESGADPNATNGPLLQTPLHVAARLENLNIIRLLLREGSNPNATNKSHQTPLALAAEYGLLDVVDFLISRDGVDVNVSDNSGRTVLHDASAKGWVEIVEKLLGKGALVEAEDKEQQTPIFDACLKGELGVLNVLIAAGAEVNARDTEGRTPIFEAGARGNVEVVELLVANGASINIEDATGKTLLHYVSAHDKLDVVRVLVGHGATVNVASVDGSTPLHEALRYGAFHTATQLLEDHGAEIAIRSTLADGGRRPKVLEPAWDKLFHLPQLGGRTDPLDLAVSDPPDGSDKKIVSEGFEGAVWPWPPVPFVLATPTVQELLYSTQYPLQIRGTRFKTGATWIHIPANNRAWIEDVFKVIYSTATQRDQLESAPSTPGADSGDDEDSYETDGSGESNSHAKRREKEKKLSQMDPSAERKRKLLSILAFIRSEFSDNRTKALRPIPVDREVVYRAHRRTITTQIQKDQMFSVAIPIIDIDMREPYFDNKKALALAKEGGGEKKGNVQKPEEYSYTRKIKEYTVDEGGKPSKVEEEYTNLMEKLRSSYEHVDPPISLDKYFHESIDENDLNVRNGDQVISRFIARQRVETEHSTENPPGGTPPTRTLTNKSGNEKKGNQQGQQQNDTSLTSTPSQLEAGLGRLLTNEELPADDEGAFRQRILTVPRFWIWKVDEDTIVTSFPQRWDETGRLGPLPRAIWTSLMENLLSKQSESKSEAELLVNDMLDHIIGACLQFKPSFKLMAKEYNYPDAFAAEIAFVSREVTKLYNDYKISLGKSVEDFSKSIKLATEYLIMVDDILNEITMIRRVYRDQGRIILSMKTSNADGGDEESLAYDTAEWGFEGMRSTEDKHLIARLKHLEKDAHMVRKSITTLLDLRQRQVTVEMALSSEVQSGILFKQSSILFIFTIATVIFAPLAWVSSLMALKIDNFTPDSWSQARIVGASFGSVLGTIALCVVGLAVYLAQQNYLIKQEKATS